jgi:inorganic pyrophosphatase
MSLMKVPAGIDVPRDINVVIEIPSHSEPIKYEVDKVTGAIFVDRFMATSMRYPCDYGYIPETLSLDGDPVDVLVISPVPLTRGSVLRCRPIGVLSMQDEAGMDMKILAVPIPKLTSMYNNVHQVSDLPKMQLDQIVHFFKHYKDLDEGKWVKLKGWHGIEEAHQEIIDSIQRYQEDKGN